MSENIKKLNDDWIEENLAETTDLLPQTEEQQLPALTEEEKQAEIKNASEEHQGLLGALMEVNKTAEVLKKIDAEESAADRNKVLNIIFENYAHKRYMTNLKLEDLKLDLIKSVMDNIDSLDLQTKIDTIEKFHNMTVVDAQKAFNMPTKGNPGMLSEGTPGGVVVNIASGSGNTIQSSTTNQNIGVAGNVNADKLKDVASLNDTLKAWKETGAPKKIKPEKDIIDVDAEPVKK